MMSTTFFNVTVGLAIFVNAFSLLQILIAIIMHKNLPIVLRGLHLFVAIIMLFVMAFIPNTVGYCMKNEGIYLLLIFFITTASYLACIVAILDVPRLQSIDEEVVKALKYVKLTAEAFAKKNGIEYIPTIQKEQIDDNGNYEYTQIRLYRSRYLLLIPFNNGESNNPINWIEEVEFSEESKIPFLEKIVSNADCFLGITNMNEILDQMISLYYDNLDKDIFISSKGFGLKLVDEIKEDYQGKAELVITDTAILNPNVSREEKLHTKKECINFFLDVLLSLNFGEAFRNDKELDKKLRDFNAEVIKRGLREHKITYGNKSNKYVQKIMNLDRE